MSEKIILDLLKEVRDDVKEIRKDVNKNTADLAIHVEGVIQNRCRIEVIENKIKPLTVVQLLKRVVLVAGGIGTIVGLALGISKLLKP